MIKKRQKRIAVVFGGMFVFSLICYMSPVDEGTVQSQTVVTDPSMMAQNAISFSDQLGEMVNQEASMFQQYQTLQSQYKMMKESKENVDKALAAIKACKSFISVVESAKDFAADVSSFKERLNSYEYLNTDEKYEYYVESLNLLEEVLEQVKEAKKTTTETDGKTYMDQFTALKEIRSQIDYLRAQFSKKKEEARQTNEVKLNGCKREESLGSTFSINLKSDFLTTDPEITNSAARLKVN
jgi:hypothetical protein